MALLDGKLFINNVSSALTQNNTCSYQFLLLLQSSDRVVSKFSDRENRKTDDACPLYHNAPLYGNCILLQYLSATG